MRAAERLTVALIAQKPYCADPTRPFEEIVHHADAEGFTSLPVREHDGAIRNVVLTVALRKLGSWNGLASITTPILATSVVADSTPIFAVLGRLRARPPSDPPLFVLGPGTISGIVTSYDVNQPAAHYVAFGLALVVESEVADMVMSCVCERRSGPPDEVLQEAIKCHALDCGPELKRWKARKAADCQLPLIAELSFAKKLELAKALGVLEQAAARCGPPYARNAAGLTRSLEEARHLRNELAHDRAGASDHSTVLSRMQMVHDLARTLVDSRSTDVETCL